MVDSVKLKSPISPLGEGHGGSEPLIAQNVIILSKQFTPTQAQLDVLNRGLTFIPTMDLGKGQKNQLRLDIQNYHRKISLATYYRDEQHSEPLPFILPSTWTPPKHKLPEEIHLLIDKDRKDFNKYYKFHMEKPNVTDVEVEAIRQLRRLKHIIIKPADKGSSVVILDREQYITEVLRQLNDKTYYKKLDEPIYLKTIPTVHDIIDTLKNKKFINYKQEIYLKGDKEPRARRFYILPKIHKDPKKWTIPYELPPGRPIVSDCGSETYQTAEYIDYFLNPLSTLHPSYVKDTYHFVEIVESLKIPENSMFFSLDVDSLYTNIDINAGLATVKKFFQRYPRANRPDDEILQLLEINLTKNDFVFNEQFYLQIKGTAMGKKFAPSYANIFMANWEEEVLAKCPIKPLHYLRYLDDIWGVWCHSLEEFEQFMKILNDHDPSITLKHTIDQSSVDFLDTTVYKGPSFLSTGKLEVKVFFKDTDTHALLFKTSFHPRHTFRGLIKSQLLRFFRICTQNRDFWEAVKTLFGALRKRGYSRTFLRQCLKTFREEKLINKKEIIPFITQYSSISTILNRKIKSNFDLILGQSGILNNYEIISAYRRNKNLRDILVKAKLKSLQCPKNTPLENFCSLKYVKSTVDRTIYKIKQEFVPQTTNIVYLIFCAKCGKKYVGETRNSIMVRMWQHRYNIKNKKDNNTPLVRHFISHGLQALKIAGIQSNRTWTTKQRKAMERRWIYLLNTKQPNGLNIKYN